MEIKRPWWGWIFTSLPLRPKLLLRDLIIGTSRMKTPVAPTPVLTLLTVMPYHRSTRWQCYLFWRAQSSSSREPSPQIKWGTHVQPPGGGGMAEGVGQGWFPILSPPSNLKSLEHDFPHDTALKNKPDWAEICESVLSYPHRTSGTQSLLPETPTQHYF